MVDAQPRTSPDDRYGRSAQAGTDRGLKIVGAVLGAGLLALVGWFGVSYVAGADVHGSLITFDVVSDRTVAVRLEVHHGDGARGVCTLRALAEDGSEVGRKEVPVGEPGDQHGTERRVTVRTTARATSAELLGCTTARG